MGIPRTAYQVIGQGGVGIRIGGVELAHHRANRLVLDNGEGSGGVKVGGWIRNLPIGEAESKVIASTFWSDIRTISRANVSSAIVSGSTSMDLPRAGNRAKWLDLRTERIIRSPIRNQLADVTMHIKEAPGV